MLVNSEIRKFVDRIASEDSLKQRLEVDFDRAIAGEKIYLAPRDRDALEAALHLIRQLGGVEQGATVLGGWGIGC